MDPRSKHWVLVGDSGQARILELRRKPYSFREVAELISPSQHLPSRELVTDASGRDYHGPGPGSHVKQPRSDPHDQAEEAFARDVARKLGMAAAQGAFDHLFVIADPRTLGRLRRNMDKALAARLVDELPLDLTHLPLTELEPRLLEIMGWKR